jgi:hypothetical protein
MDIEFCVPLLGQNTLFAPISNFPISQLYQQPVVLENAFTSSAQSSHSDVLLTLIGNTLLLSDPNCAAVTPHGAVNFDFDLKF